MTIYRASQLKSVESAKEISGVLGYQAAPLLQGKHREGSITSRLIVPERSSENSTYRQSELSENSHCVQISC